MNIEELFEGKNFECTLSKEDLYLCCHEICARLAKIIAYMISAAKLRSRDIDTVILTGGTSQLPVFQDVLRRYFKGSRMRTKTGKDPPAQGAALLAAIASGHASLKLNHEIPVLETVLATIGIELEKGRMHDIFRTGSVLPATTKSKFELVTDDRTEWKSNIYEGEDPVPHYNSLLSALTLP